MNDSERLEYIGNFSQYDIQELWNNVFGTEELKNHINQYAPYPINDIQTLTQFMNSQNEDVYSVWIIKKKEEKETIGLIVHGNYFPGLPNNFGIFIGVPYTRNGFATETLKKLLEYLLNKGFTEVFGHCYEINMGSIGMMRACDFENQGLISNNYVPMNTIRFRKSLL